MQKKLFKLMDWTLRFIISLEADLPACLRQLSLKLPHKIHEPSLPRLCKTPTDSISVLNNDSF